VNSQPGAKEILALLETLKNTVRDFVAREEKLNNDFRAYSAAAQNELVARNEQQESAVSAQFSNAEAILETQTERHRALFERRRDRISRAHASLSERGLGEISTHDRRWSERSRELVAEMEQQREKGLAQAATDRDTFQQNLAEAETGLDQLKASVRSAFRGYGRFRRLLAPERSWPEPELPANHLALYDEFRKLQSNLQEDLSRFKKFPLPAIFKFLPLWLVVILLLGVMVANPVLAHFGRHDVTSLEVGIAGGLLVLVALVHWIGGRGAAPLALTIAGNLSRAGRLLAAGREKGELYYLQEQDRIKAEFENNKHKVNQEWRQAVRDINYQRETWPATIAAKAARLEEKLEKWRGVELERLEQDQAAVLEKIKKADADRMQGIVEAHRARLAEFDKKHQVHWAELVAAWNREIQALCDRLGAASAAAEKLFPAWNAAGWEQWTPPADFQNAVKFASLEVAIEKFVETLPKDKRLAWPGPATFSVPLSLVCPLQGSILFESGKTSGEEAFGVINNIIFRLLSAAPPGRLNFTIFDPVGLGQNFASLMHLADYEDGYISSRIWTQTAQFEEKLAELNEHMEKIIQMYLRNEYATIADYNAEAGSVAEKYHFLVVASFPVNFSDNAARRLRNIAASGARCGVHLLVHWDQRNAAPTDFVPDELRQNSTCLVHNGRGFELSGWRAPGIRLLLDPPPPPEFATGFLQRIGESSKHSNRVEVPFQQIAPPETEWWRDETAELLRVPIGRSGATKLQYLEIGSGTRQHALIAGKTGSGKSTLFHVMITNLALRCSPEKVEFYLVDFKKGVEFKCYGSRHLPHARVVAIESDREFGLSVLQRVDEELRRRGDLFRQLGAQDLAGYQRAGGGAMPRTLLMIDEFQEFFTEEDHISQGAAVLLDRIVRQGRAFGIHVLLGSQTLGGAYTLARATIGQMVIRIALQCNEADALLIMDQDNPAPRLLSRPGEGIYNDAAGSIEGNSPFQAVWLSDRERDGYLAKIRERADQFSDHRHQPYPGPIVFEGNAPAEVAENFLLLNALRETKIKPPEQAVAWLGAPNSIKGPTEAVFRRQSGSNLLVVGQSDERTLTILSLALISLAAQYPKNGARFVVLDNAPAGSPPREFLQRVINSVPHEIVSAGNANLADALNVLAEELRQRTENESAGPEIFLLVHSLQNFKKLRQEDEFSFSSSDAAGAASPAAILLKLITEGAARGLHVIITCDTYNNVSRFLGRKMLTEFEMRVVFQMSATDSASLIDSPNASALGLHRALYYNDREGRLETFRPYAQPDGKWLEAAASGLKQRR
jgi:DNA segregation ATPase FtsK/SpoIIIE, S-DNA-T family